MLSGGVANTKGNLASRDGKMKIVNHPSYPKSVAKKGNKVLVHDSQYRGGGGFEKHLYNKVSLFEEDAFGFLVVVYYVEGSL